MKFTEKEIQLHIWKHRDNFEQFLDEDFELERISFQHDLSDISAHALTRNRINSKIEMLYNKLFSLELIGCEVPLEQSSNSTIRADFLANFPGDTGVAVVELKKSSQTERQAFTELLAYSNHLTTIFPAMSRDDCVYILVSPMTTRIARDAVIQTLTFDNRNIIALIPFFDDPENIETLKLKPWIPSESELVSFSRVAFSENNFSVCKIVWENSEGWWNPKFGEQPTSKQIDRFNSISAIAAQQMEETGIHGFVYCSQQWSELAQQFPYSNSLVLVGLNPYAVGCAQHFWKNNQVEPTDIPHPLECLPNVGELLLAKCKHVGDNEYVMENLYMVWSSQLFRIGKQVVDSSTKTLDSKSGLTDQDFFDWSSYQQLFFEDTTCHNFLVRPTGMLRHMYMDVMHLDYDACHSTGLENHPIHGDMPYVSINFLTSHYFFRQFVKRLFGHV
jgi:hypothetical protein